MQISGAAGISSGATPRTDPISQGGHSPGFQDGGDRSSSGAKGGTGWGADMGLSPSILSQASAARGGASASCAVSVGEGAQRSRGRGRRFLPAGPLGPRAGCGGRGAQAPHCSPGELDAGPAPSLIQRQPW